MNSTSSPSRVLQDEGVVAVNALVWSDEAKPNDYCSYNHTFADTLFGRYQIEWKGWKDYPNFSLDFAGNVVDGYAGNTLDAVRAFAQSHFDAAIRSAILHSPTERPVIETANTEHVGADVSGVSEAMVEAAQNVLFKYVEDRAAIRAALVAALSPAISAGWQPIETARKIVDETVLLRIEHMNYAIADDANKHRWEEVVTAYWTDFNSGGWVWHGLAGAPTHWQPLPALPTKDPDNGNS